MENQKAAKKSLQNTDTFFNALDLCPAGKKRPPNVRAIGALTIEVNLKPQPAVEGIPWTPKTPCSMLSPLTPRLNRFSSSFIDDDDDDNEDDTITFNSPSDSNYRQDFDKDPLLATMLIDLSSPLGGRLSQTLLSLTEISFPTTENYELYCNRPTTAPDDSSRKLRSFEGKFSVV